MIIDSLTQIVLGAAVGEVILGKKIGRKAAICGTIPDLDVLVGMFMHDLDKNLFHRSISHSFLFFFLFSPITGWVLSKIHPQENASLIGWTQLAFWSYFTHALLDSFTTWGTQLLWPWNYKIAFKSIFVIDPLYTIPLSIFLILALLKKRDDQKRAILNWSGLTISSIYLLLTLFNKQVIYHDFKKEIDRQNIHAVRFETKPAPLNNILWTATIEDSLGYHIGYKSFFDNNSEIQFEYFLKNHELITSLNSNPEIEKIIALTEGWYTVESSKYGLLINDLRFGTNTAWKAGGDFVFSYEITIDNDNVIAVKQGKKTFREDPKTLLKGLKNRIVGN